jgi:hypothetical protein
MPPGYRVQSSVGRPPRLTVPVPFEQSGCVTDTSVGAAGVPPKGFIINEPGATDIQVLSEILLTEREYEPESSSSNRGSA